MEYNWCFYPAFASGDGVAIIGTKKKKKLNPDQDSNLCQTCNYHQLSISVTADPGKM